MPKQQFIPLTEACRVAGEPYRPFWERVVAGQVDAKRDGRGWLVSRSDAERVRRERLEQETAGTGR
jgi:hypothetical protein